jgi:outer membrane receptor protein involved in Fe transport
VPFNPADPSTYPERLQVRVPGANVLDMHATYFSTFVQDKWRLGDRFTLSVGVRYDLEDIPIEEVDNARFSDESDYPRDVNNFAPRVGFSYDVAGDGRQIVRGGFGQFYDKTHFELITGIITAGVFSNSFNVNFPANAADPGPSAGQLPTDPFLLNGPTVNRDLLAQRFPAGSRLRNTGTVNVDNPDRRIPYTHQLTVGYERQLATNISWSADYVHAIGRDLFLLQDLNPGLRDTAARTSTLRRTDPALSQP